MTNSLLDGMLGLGLHQIIYFPYFSNVFRHCCSEIGPDHDKKNRGVWGCLGIRKFVRKNPWICRRAPNTWDTQMDPGYHYNTTNGQKKIFTPQIQEKATVKFVFDISPHARIRVTRAETKQSGKQYLIFMRRKQVGWEETKWRQQTNKHNDCGLKALLASWQPKSLTWSCS